VDERGVWPTLKSGGTLVFRKSIVKGSIFRLR
jgi:hypothetical protein